MANLLSSCELGTRFPEGRLAGYPDGLIAWSRCPSFPRFHSWSVSSAIQVSPSAVPVRPLGEVARAIARVP